MKTKSIKQVVNFIATPHDVYETLMDSKKHAAFSGSKVKMSRKVGGKFSAYDGGIVGSNKQLVKDKKIVQKWRCVMDDWPESHYSTVTFAIKRTPKGSRLTFTQTGVPAKCSASISKGWKNHYWDPMRRMFDLY